MTLRVRVVAYQSHGNRAHFFSYTCTTILYLKKIPPILPALFWLIFTTVLLCLPGSAFPKENWFDKIWLDKWIHVALFATLVFLWCQIVSGLPPDKRRRYWQIAFYFFLYGIIMEFIRKFFIPNRSFDLGDIIADGVGCVVGGIRINKKVYKKIDPCRNRGRNQN